MIPLSRLENERQHGRRIGEQAEDIWGWSTPAGRLRAQRRADLFCQLGAFTLSHRLLEVGCGTGLFTRKVYEQTQAQIVAVDISEDLLEQARQKLPSADFRVDDAMNLSFADGAFDGVYGSSILHHLDLESALREIYRVLKPGARMVFAEPNMLNPQILLQKNVPWIKRWMGDAPDETAVVRWRMIERLTQLGFEQVQAMPYDFLHPHTPKAMIKPVQWLGRHLEQIPVLREIAGSVVITAQKPALAGSLIAKTQANLR
ncbi:MAG: methyltransferase domain-containing protein [Deltaproteobacteria bacterium]|nr:methyltransferase domain-containing protein [Deltaproteobacteria bacterium]